ncbi:hypothetical protein SRIMM317S_05945 [Streptomyces rimosus subsp. rimosus]
MQRRLEQMAVYPGPNSRFDRAVREAVIAFQRTFGLREDPAGVYGVQTRRSLEARTVSREPGHTPGRPVNRGAVGLSPGALCIV